MINISIQFDMGRRSFVQFLYMSFSSFVEKRQDRSWRKSKIMPIFSTTGGLVAATNKAVRTNISFYKYFHPFPSPFFNNWSSTPPWTKYLSLFPFLFTPPSLRNETCFWNKSTLSSFILILLFKLIEHWTEVLDHKVYDRTCREHLVSLHFLFWLTLFDFIWQN